MSSRERTFELVVGDPSPIFRAGIARLLAPEPGIECTVAGDLAGVIAAVTVRTAAVLLADDLVPGGAVPAVETLRRSFRGPIVAWGQSPSREGVLEALEAGAAGYLRKDISSEGLLRSLRGIRAGQVPIPRDLAGVAVDELRRVVERERGTRLLRLLSPRELEVLELLAEGAGNCEVAERLDISQFTVKRHVQNLLHKLEVPSRGAAAALYRAGAPGVAVAAGVTR